MTASGRSLAARGTGIVTMWGTRLADLAKKKQNCEQTFRTRRANVVQFRGSVRNLSSRNGRPELAHLRMQSPLHDTADDQQGAAIDPWQRCDVQVVSPRRGRR